jgi:GAF domain-containing protein
MDHTAAAQLNKEESRLKAVARYHDFNLDRDKELNEIVKLATYICGAPIALITLMDREEQYVLAKAGADVDVMPRATSFCTHAIETDSVMVVDDALEDERFRDIPVVAGAPHIRFYASANLRSHDGYNVGTLCVYDVEPNALNGPQREALAALANQVSHIMELDRAIRMLKRKNDDLTEIARIQSHEYRQPVSTIMGLVELLRTSESSEHPEYHLLLEQAAAQLDDRIREVVGKAAS